MEKLATEFEDVLRQIADYGDVKPNITSMRRLLRFKYISLQMGTGWVLTSKGASYLEEWSGCHNYVA